MPLPPDAFEIPGGCNCGAVRYSIHVPEASKRPLHPKSHPSSTTPSTYLPLLFTDHCNDCRRANGSIIPAWICQPLDWLKVELKLRSDQTGRHQDPPIASGRVEDNTGLPLSITGKQAFLGPHDQSANTYLHYYESSPGCIRSFCARCGTHLSFAEAASMPGIVDITLGTVDRAVLEQDWMIPTRQCYCDLTIPWMQTLVEGGRWDEMGRHPKADYNEYCKKT